MSPKGKHNKHIMFIRFAHWDALCFREVMRIYLAIVLFFAPLISNAEEVCLNYKDKNYLALNKDEKNFKHPLYSEIKGLNELARSDYKSDIIRKITETANPMYTVKVSCSDDSNIFFSIYLGDIRIKLMDGVILMESARYFSGPFSLVNPENEVVIIQADQN